MDKTADTGQNAIQFATNRELILVTVHVESLETSAEVVFGFLRSSGPLAGDDLFNALKLFPSCLQLPLQQRPLNSRPFVATRRVVERSNKGWSWFTQLVSGHTSGRGSIHGSVHCMSHTGLEMKHDGVRLFGALFRSRARRCSASLRYQSDRSR